MGERNRILVSSLVWNTPGDLFSVQAETIEKLGYAHRIFRFDEPVPAGSNVVFIQGPYGSLLPLVRRLLEFPPEKRPVLVYWFQQSLQLLRLEWANALLARQFSELHRRFEPGSRLFKGLDRAGGGELFKRGKRLGYLGDILWLDARQLLDVLALSSTVYADYLAALRVPSLVVPRGYHPSYGASLNLERDIAAIWMGKLRTRRRSRAIYWLKEQLERRGQSMHVYDGQENPFIYGSRRTEILNRSWFVLNVFFSGPQDELSIRFFIAGANGAVVLTEPGKNRYPFVHGRHLVESPVEEMPEKVAYYLDHREEWAAISRNMLVLLQNELTLERTIARLIERAERILENGRGERESRSRPSPQPQGAQEGSLP